MLDLFLEDFGFDITDMTVEEAKIVFEDYKNLICGED